VSFGYQTGDDPEEEKKLQSDRGELRLPAHPRCGFCAGTGRVKNNRNTIYCGCRYINVQYKRRV